MSLLMQALKKAEHAKQKQGSSLTIDPAEDKNPLTIQNNELALSPAEAVLPVSETNINPLAMELSPVAEKIEPTYSEPVQTEPAYRPEPPTTSFVEPVPAQAGFDSTYSDQNKPSSPATNARFENDSRADTESLSQQQTVKMRLEQQKADALEAGKVLAEQQKAKAVFTSKQPKTNRRTLWIGVIGLLVVLMFFGGGYYYLQLAPQNSGLMAHTLPIQTTAIAQQPTPTAAIAPLPTTSSEGVAVKDVKTEAVPIQAVAVAQKNAEPPIAPATRQAAPENLPGKNNTERASVQRKARSATDVEAIEIRQTTVDSHINPALSKGYQFFMNGDLAAAQQQYQTVLQQDPNNRDAILGQIAIAISRKQSSQAGSYYLKLLELDPADPDAIAGITSLQGGDPSEIESRLKKALTQNPQAGAILFALGNLYAQQSRWSDAQQYYFRAYGAAPINADYAFNLAVSLDRLNQEKLALEFYQRALTLAQNKPGNFNKVAIQDRINQLQSAHGS